MNFHSVMDRPERVRRVMPPSTTRLATQAEQPPSHHATARLVAGSRPCATELAATCATLFSHALHLFDTRFDNADEINTRGKRYMRGQPCREHRTQEGLTDPPVECTADCANPAYVE